MCFEGLGQKGSSLSFFGKTARDLGEKHLCTVFEMQLLGGKNNKSCISYNIAKE